MSLPVRGAWIEIVISATCVPRALSLPVRGAWIEMTPLECCRLQGFRRSPCGERGLKSIDVFCSFVGSSRSPCGERGLK